MWKRKAAADEEMALLDEESPEVRAALNEYGGYAWQVFQVRSVRPGITDREIIELIKKG